MKNMNALHQKNILLGITGGIAAYKSAYLCRLLTECNANVQVVMSNAATKFITPLTFETLSHHKVLTDTFTEPLAHIDFAKTADLILIAPASANTLAHLANGLANNLLQNIVLARRCPLLLAPAMNTAMWENPATKRNVAMLENDGVQILHPICGTLACGDVGRGKMMEPAGILEAAESLLSPKILKDKKMVITAGPTFEKIDSVRGLTNLSSGKMGYALARAANNAGAKVTLISGKVALPAPENVDFIATTSAEEMHRAALSFLGKMDVFISVAAVSDYRPKNAVTHKLKKNKERLNTLELTENPDILAEIAAAKNAPFCVGFAAESENLLANAREKRQKKNIPLIVANDIAQGFGGENNRIFLIDSENQSEFFGKKTDLAWEIIQNIAQKLKK